MASKQASQENKPQIVVVDVVRPVFVWILAVVFGLIFAVILGTAICGQ